MAKWELVGLALASVIVLFAFSAVQAGDEGALEKAVLFYASFDEVRNRAPHSRVVRHHQSTSLTFEHDLPQRAARHHS